MHRAPQNQALCLSVISCQHKVHNLRQRQAPSMPGHGHDKSALLKSQWGFAQNLSSVAWTTEFLVLQEHLLGRKLGGKTILWNPPLLLVGTSSVWQLRSACISTGDLEPISQSCIRHTTVVETIQYFTNFKWHAYLRTHSSEVTLQANNAWLRRNTTILSLQLIVSVCLWC